MKNSKVNILDRQQKMLQHIRKNGTVSINDLAELFYITPITVRRDLIGLEEKGYVKRYFGGVKSLLPPDLDEAPTPSIEDPKALIHAKIALKATELIKDGDTIFMNSSSTALLMMEYLKDKSVLVVTNNGRALYSKRDPQIELILTGGEVYGQKKSLVGEFALNALYKITATKCILGVSGISVDGGITSSVIQETAINKTMLERCSGEKIILADGSKIGTRHNFFSGNITDITHLITDTSASKEHLDQIAGLGINIVLSE